MRGAESRRTARDFRRGGRITDCGLVERWNRRRISSGCRSQAGCGGDSAERLQPRQSSARRTAAGICRDGLEGDPTRVSRARDRARERVAYLSPQWQQSSSEMRVFDARMKRYGMPPKKDAAFPKPQFHREESAIVGSTFYGCTG